MTTTASLDTNMTARTAQLRRDMGQARRIVNNNTSRMTGDFDSTAAGAARLITRVGLIGVAVTGAFAAGGIAGIVKTGAALQDIRTTLQSVTGDGDAAFESIKRFAVTSQFGVEELSKTFIQLSTAGIAPTTKLLTLFTDTAANTTDQLGTLNAITNLFTRGIQGGLGLEELEQLAQRGVPVYKILNEQLGITRLEVSGIGKDAEGASRILEALRVGLTEQFGGSTANRLNNVSTSFSNLSISIKNAADLVAQGFSSNLVKVLQGITSIIDKSEGDFLSFGRAVGRSLNDAVLFINSINTGSIAFDRFRTQVSEAGEGIREFYLDLVPVVKALGSAVIALATVVDNVIGFFSLFGETLLSWGAVAVATIFVGSRLISVIGFLGIGAGALAAGFLEISLGASKMIPLLARNSALILDTDTRYTVFRKSLTQVRLGFSRLGTRIKQVTVLAVLNRKAIVAWSAVMLGLPIIIGAVAASLGLLATGQGDATSRWDEYTDALARANKEQGILRTGLEATLGIWESLLQVVSQYAQIPLPGSQGNGIFGSPFYSGNTIGGNIEDRLDRTALNEEIARLDASDNIQPQEFPRNFTRAIQSTLSQLNAFGENNRPPTRSTPELPGLRFPEGTQRTGIGRLTREGLLGADGADLATQLAGTATQRATLVRAYADNAFITKVLTESLDLDSDRVTVLNASLMANQDIIRRIENDIGALGGGGAPAGTGSPPAAFRAGPQITLADTGLDLTTALRSSQEQRVAIVRARERVAVAERELTTSVDLSATSIAKWADIRKEANIVIEDTILALQPITSTLGGLKNGLSELGISFNAIEGSTRLSSEQLMILNRDTREAISIRKELLETENLSAASAARLTERYDELTSRLSSATEVIPTFFDEITSGLEGLGGVLKSSVSSGLREAFSGTDNILKKFGEVFEAGLTSAILDSVAKSFSDQAIDFLGSLISSFAAGGAGSFDTSSAAAISGGISPSNARARGGPVTAGETYLVGEEGPEAFVPQRSGRIVPNNALGGASAPIIINLEVTGDVTEATQRVVRRMGVEIADSVAAVNRERGTA